MTPFEIVYTAFRPYLPSLHRIAFEEIKNLSIKDFGGNPRILDVGGRKSHITIGVPGMVTISDLPRNTSVQKMLNLGITDEIASATTSRRSNIAGIIYDDMTNSSIEDNSFDINVAIEVLEHVEEDEKFVKEVYRVLKPGGYFYMTTPNGDTKPIPANPDHKRHYKKQQLIDLLSSVFPEVHVKYAIPLSKYRTMGLNSYKITDPVSTLKTMYGNRISYKESMMPEAENMANNTAHLIAVCKK